MNRSSGRRQPNRIDIPRWLSLTKQAFAKVWSLPGGPFVSIIILLLLIVSLAAVFHTSISEGKIYPGVQVAGYDVGRLDKEHAANALKHRLEKQISKPITAEFQGNSEQIVPASLNLRIDYKKSVSSAYEYGRSGPFSLQVYQRVKAWFKTADIVPEYQINEKKLQLFLYKIAGKKHKPSVDSSILIKEGKPYLTKSKNGIGINPKKAAANIIKAALNPQKISFKLEKLAPRITEKQAANALKEAKIMLKKPVVLKHKSNSWVLSKEKIKELFTTEIRGEILKATFNKGTTIYYIQTVTKGLNKEPSNAKFEVYGSKVAIIPSGDGARVDKLKTYNSLLSAALRKTARKANVVVKTIKPSRTTEIAKKMGIKELVSTFTTYYPAGKPRVKNIHLLADLLDGMLIAPGEEFTFNGRIGKRTSERGFVAAPEIRNGEFVETVGGGICQVSTTTFNAALLAGLPIGQRSPHSLFVKKYPPGRDAAVSYPQPDLTFTNDTKAWILIKGGYTASSISISFYSTDYGREVSFVAKLVNRTPYPTKEEKDATLEKGKKKEVKKGVLGQRYLVTRTVKQDGKVIRETKIRSAFDPVPRVVKVGTKEKPKEEKKTD